MDPPIPQCKWRKAPRTHTDPPAPRRGLSEPSPNGSARKSNPPRYSPPPKLLLAPMTGDLISDIRECCLEQQVLGEECVSHQQAQLAVVLRQRLGQRLLPQGPVPAPRPRLPSPSALPPPSGSHRLTPPRLWASPPQQCVTALLQQKDNEVADLRQSLEAQTAHVANQLEAALLLSVVS